MTDLSPAAQAVLDAYFSHADLLNREVSHEEMIAAALRAAADQMGCYQSKRFLYSIADAIKLRNIAAELETLTTENR
jgi:hypothetical protein